MFQSPHHSPCFLADFVLGFVHTSLSPTESVSIFYPYPASGSCLGSINCTPLNLPEVLSHKNRTKLDLLIVVPSISTSCLFCRCCNSEELSVLSISSFSLIPPSLRFSQAWLELIFPRSLSSLVRQNPMFSAS